MVCEINSLDMYGVMYICVYTCSVYVYVYAYCDYFVTALQDQWFMAKSHRSSLKKQRTVISDEKLKLLMMRREK